MAGIVVRGKEPRSKTVVKDAVRDTPQHVRIFTTSAFGGEFDGKASTLAEYAQARGKEIIINFVGPDPNRNRKFYGTITAHPDGSLTVK